MRTQDEYVLYRLQESTRNSGHYHNKIVSTNYGELELRKYRSYHNNDVLPRLYEDERWKDAHFSWFASYGTREFQGAEK